MKIQCAIFCRCYTLFCPCQYFSAALAIHLPLWILHLFESYLLNQLFFITQSCVSWISGVLLYAYFILHGDHNYFVQIVLLYIVDSK